MSPVQRRFIRVSYGFILRRTYNAVIATTLVEAMFEYNDNTPVEICRISIPGLRKLFFAEGWMEETIRNAIVRKIATEACIQLTVAKRIRTCIPVVRIKKPIATHRYFLRSRRQMTQALQITTPSVRIYCIIHG
jgi:hypothetical protein